MTREEAMIEMVKGKKVIHPDMEGHYYLLEKNIFKLFLPDGTWRNASIPYDDGYEIKKNYVPFSEHIKVKKEVDVFIREMYVYKSEGPLLHTDIPAKLIYEVEE